MIAPTLRDPCIMRIVKRRRALGLMNFRPVKSVKELFSLHEWMHGTEQTQNSSTVTLLLVHPVRERAFPRIVTASG